MCVCTFILVTTYHLCTYCTVHQFVTSTRLTRASTVNVHVPYLIFFRVTAFVLETLNDAQETDWELDFFISTDLLNKIMLWLCEQQTPEGSFFEHAPLYDRKMWVSLKT